MRSLISFLTIALLFAYFVSVKAEDDEVEIKVRACLTTADCAKPYESYKCENLVCKCHGPVYTSEPGYPCLKLVGLGKPCEIEEQCTYNDSLSECTDDVCKCKKGSTKGEDKKCHKTEKLPVGLLLFPALFVLGLVGACIGCVVCLVCCCCKKKKVETELEDD